MADGSGEFSPRWLSAAPAPRQAHASAVTFLSLAPASADVFAGAEALRFLVACARRFGRAWPILRSGPIRFKERLSLSNTEKAI